MPTAVASRMPSAYLSVIKRLSGCQIPILGNIEGLICNEKQRSATTALGDLFAKHGSDKSTRHDYHRLYGAILPLFRQAPRILEVGLGSNNTEIASNMGIDGRPGASLRAFKEFWPDAIVDGADIDKTIRVDGCRVFYVDQTNPGTFQSIKAEGELTYDLIIDDGLHSPDANLYTLDFALSALSNDGIVLIEDIPEAALPIWLSLQYQFLHADFKTRLVRTKAAYVFIATKSLSLPGLL